MEKAEYEIGDGVVVRMGGDEFEGTIIEHLNNGTYRAKIMVGACQNFVVNSDDILEVRSTMLGRVATLDEHIELEKEVAELKKRIEKLESLTADKEEPPERVMGWGNK